jgi:hypothetical protein
MLTSTNGSGGRGERVASVERLSEEGEEGGE